MAHSDVAERRGQRQGRIEIVKEEGEPHLAPPDGRVYRPVPEVMENSLSIAVEELLGVWNLAFACSQGSVLLRDGTDVERAVDVMDDQLYKAAGIVGLHLVDTDNLD